MPRTTIQNTQFYPPVVWRNASRNFIRRTFGGTQYAIRDTKYVRLTSGSALILAVVLTSLLAVIGVAFLLSSRVDSIATSALAENKELNLAVDTVIAKISEQLVADMPRVDANGVPIEEYYDYPDALNAWLASLEPNDSLIWPHISDIYHNLGQFAYNMIPDINEDYQHWTRVWPTLPADADGDGVTDSRWIRLPDMTSGKGKPIYAAVRVIDNSAMLNVNTGYKFDPSDPNLVDGSSQRQINLMALSWRPFDNPPGTYTTAEEGDLLRARSPVNPFDFSGYERDVIWRYAPPYGPNTPFDISDELEMRNRFVLDHFDCVTRIEMWGGEMRKYRIWTPVTSGGAKFRAWATRVTGYDHLDPNYAYRHIATIHNMDRVFRPNNQKMFNVNRPIQTPTDQNELFQTIKTAFAETIPGDVNFLAAQTTANLIDYIDGFVTDPNDEVTVVYDDANFPHFGFETPCVYISELAQAFQLLDPNGDPNDPNNIVSAFAIELHKPYWEDNRPADGQWRLSIRDIFGFVVSDIPIFWSGSNRFHVMGDDPSSLLNVNFSDVNAPNDINEPNGTPQPIDVDANLLIPGTILQLSRFVPDANTWLTVDTAVVPDVNTGWPGPNDIDVGQFSFQRDITLHKCIRRIWDSSIPLVHPPTLGGPNFFVDIFDAYLFQAHPANTRFTNIGQIGMLFAVNTYAIGTSDTELNTRLNLADPAVQNIFKYLTVMDPFEYDHPDTETRIKGRINVNTAPWFVLAQLPWVSAELAQAIVAYRDKMLLRDTLGNDIADYTDRTFTTGSAVLLREAPGFENAGELANVTNTAAVASAPAYDIRFYARADGLAAGDQVGFPDLGKTNPVGPRDDCPCCPNCDGSPDDFEERDLIFSRISNLVTVRSDLFTAYILVRIGRDGPQKRVVAVLDRSEVTPTNTKVKLIALHPVPDPR